MKVVWQVEYEESHVHNHVCSKSIAFLGAMSLRLGSAAPRKPVDSVYFQSERVNLHDSTTQSETNEVNLILFDVIRLQNFVM